MAKKCSHENTRLKCVDCEKPICSACMVECPVGVRCKDCIKPKGQPKLTIAPWFSVAKAFGASALIGCAVGWLMPHLSIPYISCLICFFLGIYSGRWLKGHLDHKLGSSTGITVVFGVLFGIALSPLAALPLLILSILTGQSPSIFDSLLAVLSVLFDPVCFFAGILRPTLWGDF